MEEYLEFLKTKIAISKEYGFKINKSKLPDVLRPEQKDIVEWAIRGGRRAIFVSFGFGKTVIQLTICNEIIKKEGGKALIVVPLGVKQEFTEDAKNLLNLNIQYVKTQKEVESSDCNILITNYERVRDGDIQPDYFTVTSLDEASVLRGYGTKTYQTFLPKFKNVKYRFIATATPAPNKYKELIHYGGYLGIMDTGQALTRFFKRDSTKANKLTLYAHKETEFWYWLSSWGVFAKKPSDINKKYSDDGFDMPKIKVHYHELDVNHQEAGIERDGQIKMFRDATISLPDACKEKRDSLDNRVDRAMEIINNDKDSHYIIWHELEDERRAIKKALPEAIEVFGGLTIEQKEERILNFAYGKNKYLATKPKINGSGCNFQRHCNKAIFLGIGYKFNDFIQAVHRIYRFLQTKQVEIHLIYTESEAQILQTLLEKWKKHDEMVDNMIEIIRENGINAIKTKEKLMRTLGIERKELKGNLYTVANNDCVLESKLIEDNSVGLVVTSIPFSNHYEYTPSYNDFGHTENNNQFWEQMDFLTPELHRMLIPGRIAAIHVKDRILFSSMTDYSFPTVSPFHAETIFHFMKHKFGFLGMITIETDVVRENNQTYRLGWTEKCKDGSKMGVGSPEYLLLFRKQPTSYDNAYSDLPVFKNKSEYTRGMWQIDARAKWNSSGNRFLTPQEIGSLQLDTLNHIFTNYFESEIYDYEKHIKTANQLEKLNKLPATFETLRLKSRNWYLWDDVNRMMTLNTNQSRKNLNMHICPLQFDIVDRIITRFSNKNDLVFDPFGGLFTVPYRSLKLGRKGRASELNADYYRDGCAYMRAIESEISMPTLFDII